MFAKKMSPSTKRAIIKILCLYLGTMAVFLSIFFGLSYKKDERHIFAQQISDLRESSIEIYEILYDENTRFAESKEKILDIAKEVLILDRDNGILLNSTGENLSDKEIESGFAKRKNSVIICPSIHNQLKKSNKKSTLANKYLKDTKYKVFIKDANLDSQIFSLRIKTAIYFLCSMLIASVIAYLLVRLFLKPLQMQIDNLNNFIKDATHEINTPLSVILMSVEMLESKPLDSTLASKINRLKLAAKSLNHLYKDLVALNFPHTIDNEKKILHLDSLLKERLLYFELFFMQKSLKVNTTIQSCTFLASAEKLTCMLDNLLQNAYKFNKKNGSIDIVLKNGFLSIKDSGCGIKQEHLDSIFERYTRHNQTNGGFGIGLELVKRICDEYHISINIKSDENGSEFILKWQSF